jgi:predicted flap endonuclease-1-like 5' DNA nuclease
MKLETLYAGDDLFAGDRVIWLRALPAGARVTAATATLSPLGGPGFATTIDLADGQGPWGTTATSGASAQPEVDFHARRTLLAVTGTGDNATLQIDLGGVYAGVANDGSLMGPGKTALSLTLNRNAQPVPSLTVNKVKLMGTGLTITSVTVRAIPSNLTLRVGALPPFWTRLGELTQSETSLDFSPVLNAALLQSPPENGFHQLAFTLHTDSLARLALQLSVSYVVDLNVLPPHLNEVTLPYSFSTLPGVDQAVLTARLPRGATPVRGQSQAALRGQFQPTRIASGPLGAEPVTTPVVVSPQCSLAQWLQPEHEIALTGLDLPMGSTTPGLSGLSVAIHADDDGKPANQVLMHADVRIDKPLPGQSSWGSVSLSAPLRLEAAHRYWLVLQSRDGEAFWNAEEATAEALPLQCSADGGLSWRAARVPGQTRAYRARFRLRQNPDQYSVPIQIQIGAGPAAVIRRLDEYAPLGRIEFNVDFSERLREYLVQTRGDAPCGAGDLIRNGRFDLPAHDDATNLLLNLEDPSQGRSFDPNGIDLTRQRIVTVKVHHEDLLRIDCAGLDPAHTQLAEVMAAGRIGAESNVFVTNEGALRLSSIAELAPWCRETVPAEWQRVSGHVYQVRVAESSNRGAGRPSQTVIYSPVVLVSPPDAADWLACQPDEPEALAAPSILAQTVEVRAGCRYALSFYYLRDDDREGKEGSAALDACRWDVIWLDAAGRHLGQTGGALEARFLKTLDLLPALPGWQSFTAPVSPPADASRAQVTFTRQPDGILALEAVSLVATAEVLDNGDFVRTTHTPSGAAVADGWASQGNVTVGSGRVCMQGGASEAGTISQRAPVIAGTHYTLRVLAESTRIAGEGDLDRARVELAWRAGETLVGEPVVIMLDDRSFPERSWSGPAPAGSTHVDVRVIQPITAGSLLVRSVSLMEADEVAVPIVPLAESPGELTVTALRIAYDRIDERPPIVERVGSLPRVQPVPVSAPPPAPAPAPAAPVVAPVSASSPLTAVAGIGPARERELRALGITALGQLAAARPALVARLRGVSPAMARQYVAQARRLLRR